MDDSGSQTIDQLTIDLGKYIDRIEGNKTNRTHWADLYDTVLRSIPYLSDKEESGFLTQSITGDLGEDFIVIHECFLESYNFVIVIDKRKLDEDHYVARSYYIRGLFGYQIPFDAITEWTADIDLETVKERVVHQNLPFGLLLSNHKL